MTDKRKTNAQLIAELTQLRTRVAELETAEAARQQTEAALRESNAELQTRNEELDAFARTVAHYLKNPLRVVMAYAELLVETYGTLPDKDVRQTFAAISRSGRRAANLINSLFLLASFRQQDVQAEPLDMAHIVDGVLLCLTDPIRDSGADIHLPDRASWPVALGYAPWIEEIWLNYLGNAITYGGPHPRIELGATRQPPGFIRFSVRGYGPGPHARTAGASLCALRAAGAGAGRGPRAGAVGCAPHRR